MSKIKLTLSGFMFLLLLLFGFSRVFSRNPDTKNTHDGNAPSGTLQKMIVENASVTMQLDLNGLNGSNSLVARPVTLEFSAAANSFFPILVFNDLLRAVKPGSMALIPSRSGGIPALPVRLGASVKQLVVEKRPSNQSFGLAVRDSKTGFTFFDVAGGDYDYNANARSLGIEGGRLLISKEFANALGRPSDAGSVVGKISVGAAMQPIEITQLVNGKRTSVVDAPVEPTCRSGSACTGSRARYYRWGPAGHGASRLSGGITGRPGDSDDFLQQWRSAGQLFRITRHRSSVLSGKSLSDERWRR